MGWHTVFYYQKICLRSFISLMLSTSWKRRENDYISHYWLLSVASKINECPHKKIVLKWQPRHTERLGGSKCAVGLWLTLFSYRLCGRTQAVREMNQSVVIYSTQFKSVLFESDTRIFLECRWMNAACEMSTKYTSPAHINGEGSQKYPLRAFRYLNPLMFFWPSVKGHSHETEEMP